MERPPKNPNEPILNQKDWSTIILYGLCISAAVLGIVIYAEVILELPAGTINNMAFYTLVLAQLLHIFNIPKGSASFFFNEVTKNGWVWGAIVFSFALTYGAYLIEPVAKALSLSYLSLENFVLAFLL